MHCSVNDLTSLSRSRLTPVMAQRLTRGTSPHGSEVGRTSSAACTAWARQGDSWPLTASRALARQTVPLVDCSSCVQDHSPSHAATTSSLITSPCTSKATALTSRAVWDSCLCSWWCSSASSALASCGSTSVRLQYLLVTSRYCAETTYRSKLNAPTLVMRSSGTRDLTDSSIVAAGLISLMVCLIRAISSRVNRSHCNEIDQQWTLLMSCLLPYLTALYRRRLFVFVLQIPPHSSTHAQNSCHQPLSDTCQSQFISPVALTIILSRYMSLSSSSSTHSEAASGPGSAWIKLTSSYRNIPARPVVSMNTCSNLSLLFTSFSSAWTSSVLLCSINIHRSVITLNVLIRTAQYNTRNLSTMALVTVHITCSRAYH